MNGDTLFEALSHVGADLIDRACENPASDRPKGASPVWAAPCSDRGMRLFPSRRLDPVRSFLPRFR